MNTPVLKAADGQGSHSATGGIVLLAGIGWLTVVAVVGLTGMFDAAPGERPWLVLLAVILPVFGFVLSYLRFEAFRHWMLALDIRHLILLHSWRMIGMGFIFLYFQDRLPALFALPAGLGDAMAAIGAVFLAIAMYERAGAVAPRRILAWNTFGLLDFVLAVSLGVLTRSGALLHLDGHVGSEIMGTFPIVLIPAFAVPFFIITHLVIYIQLKSGTGKRG